MKIKFSLNWTSQPVHVWYMEAKMIPNYQFLVKNKSKDKVVTELENSVSSCSVFGSKTDTNSLAKPTDKVGIQRQVKFTQEPCMFLIVF